MASRRTPDPGDRRRAASVRRGRADFVGPPSRGQPVDDTDAPTVAARRRPGGRARPATPPRGRTRAPQTKARPARRARTPAPTRQSHDRRRASARARSTDARTRALAPAPAPRRPPRAAPGRTRTAPRGRRRKGATPHVRRTIRADRRPLSTRFGAGQPRRRLIATLVGMLLVLLLVLFKVGLLQTFQGDSLRSAAAEQWTRTRTVIAERGSIFDRNGDELALSVPAATVAVNPRQVEDIPGTIATLGGILGLSPERQQELIDQMEPRDRGFLYVARQVDADLAEQVDALDIYGVSTYREDRRDLPGGVTARSVVGRTDIDGVGISGLELQYNDVLQGVSGERELEVGPDGSTIAGSGRVVRPAVPGNDLVTTIDRSVQNAVENALLARTAETGAQGGQAIVMDTDTGDILAMASVDLTDDGVYAVTSGNYSAVSAYEPGSVGKVITIAAALNEGTVTPDTMFSVPWQRVYTRGGDMLSDSHPHPEVMMSVRDIIVESSNIGTISVSQTLGDRNGRSSFDMQYQYLRAFGIGDVTALDFPQESPGILAPWQSWEGTEKYTVAYGQGFASTPIQLIAAVNTVANDGTYVAPRLVSATVDSAGDLHEAPPAATHEVVSQTAAEELQLMMRDVVCEGTATRAQVDGLSVAGKTGTGYIAQPDGTYFLPNGQRAYYTSFVGFLPAEDPQVTILVSIDQPATDRNGGGAAGPVFRDLAPTMVHELGIVPLPGSTGCST